MTIEVNHDVSAAIFRSTRVVNIFVPRFLSDVLPCQIQDADSRGFQHRGDEGAVDFCRRALAYHSIQEEVIELAEDEKDGRKDIVPDWSDFVQNTNDNVRHYAKIQYRCNCGPDAGKNKQWNTVQCVWWIGRAKGMSECESDVERDIGRCCEECDHQEGKWYYRAQSAIFNYLRGNNSIPQEGPEGRCHYSSMNGSEDCESCRSLFEERPGGDDLKRERDEVHDEEVAEFHSANGSFSSTSHDDQTKNDQDADAASDDISDVAERTLVASSENAAGRVNAHGSRIGVCRDASQSAGGMVLQLAIEEITPGI